jgi:hypothetical protein
MQQPSLRDRCGEVRTGLLKSKPVKNPLPLEGYSQKVGRAIYAYDFTLIVNGKELDYQFFTDDSFDGEFSKALIAPFFKDERWGDGCQITVFSFPNSQRKAGSDGKEWLNVYASRAVDFELKADAQYMRNKQAENAAKREQYQNGGGYKKNGSAYSKPPTTPQGGHYQPKQATIPSFSSADFEEGDDF